MDDVEESVGDQEEEFLSEQQEVHFLDLQLSSTCSVLQASSKDLQEADEAMKKLGLAKVRLGGPMMVIINIVSRICLTQFPTAKLCKRDTIAFQNDAEWEAELEGELNEYEMVGNFKVYG